METHIRTSPHFLLFTHINFLFADNIETFLKVHQLILLHIHPRQIGFHLFAFIRFESFTQIEFICVFHFLTCAKPRSCMRKTGLYFMKQHFA